MQLGQVGASLPPRARLILFVVVFVFGEAVLKQCSNVIKILVCTIILSSSTVPARTTSVKRILTLMIPGKCSRGDQPCPNHFQQV